MAYQYVETDVGSLSLQKFVKLEEVNTEFEELTKVNISDNPFDYMLEVYMEE